MDARSVTTIESGCLSKREDYLVRQISFTLLLNGKPVISSVCSPGGLRELAAGYLLSQGLIRPDDESLSILLNGCTIIATANEIREISEPVPVKSNHVMSPEIISRSVTETMEKGTVFRKTGGTHSASIYIGNSPECHVEDISRSAALEKTIGCAVLKNLELCRSIAVLSSRVPVDFVRKTARVGIPVIAAVSAPTAEAVDEAEQLGICLCGFVRGSRMNVYTNRWRLGL